MVQRVSRASVQAGGAEVAAIGRGFLVLVGVGPNDSAATAARLGAKVAGLRLFEDTDGKTNLGLQDVGGAVLAVSQFTLYGDVRRGRRPSFADAAPPALARSLYDAFCAAIEAEGIPCGRGRFGEHMEVALVNDGPVTLIIDSDDLASPRRA